MSHSWFLLFCEQSRSTGRVKLGVAGVSCDMKFPTELGQEEQQRHRLMPAFQWSLIQNASSSATRTIKGRLVQSSSCAALPKHYQSGRGLGDELPNIQKSGVQISGCSVQIPFSTTSSLSRGALNSIQSSGIEWLSTSSFAFLSGRLTKSGGFFCFCFFATNFPACSFFEIHL